MIARHMYIDKHMFISRKKRNIQEIKYVFNLSVNRLEMMNKDGWVNNHNQAGLLLLTLDCELWFWAV